MGFWTRIFRIYTGAATSNGREEYTHPAPFFPLEISNWKNQKYCPNLTLGKERWSAIQSCNSRYLPVAFLKMVSRLLQCFSRSVRILLWRKHAAFEMFPCMQRWSPKAHIELACKNSFALEVNRHYLFKVIPAHWSNTQNAPKPPAAIVRLHAIVIYEDTSKAVVSKNGAAQFADLSGRL